MKSPRLKILVTALFVATSTSLQARFVTLTVNGNLGNGPTNLLARLTIQSNEVATVRSIIAAPGYPVPYLTVMKDGLLFVISPPVVATVNPDPLIAGPAVFQLQPLGSGYGGPGFCTIEITPESFPPDKTLIIPEGTGANITFECSTNLLDWNPVWQGTYTNAPSNKFFRIRADRLP